MKRLIVGSVLVVLAVAIFVFVKNKPFQTETARAKGRFEVGAVAFETAPMEKLDLAAKYLETEITHAELVSRSPVLKDLLNTKLKILSEAVIAKFPEIGRLQQPPTVELYMEKPAEKAELVRKNPKLALAFSSQRPADGILKFNNKVYDRSDLPLNQVQYSQVEMQIFDEKLRVLGDLYVKQLLLKIAKDNNTTIQGYVNKSILGLPLKDVSDIEVKLFAADKGIDFSEQDSALKERLRKILQERKTENSIEEHLKDKFPGEIGKIYFYPPSYEIPMKDPAALLPAGEKDSALPTVMVFTSPKCSGCGHLADGLEEIRSKYKNKVRFGFVHFFYGDDWRDQLAAQASLCLNSQSNDAFWKFFSRLSKSKDEISETHVKETAKSTGIDKDEFEKCFIAQTYKDEVQKQVKYASQLGVTTAPTVIYGSQVLTGSNIEKQLKNAIASGLQR
ncbi:MAG: thioredoxin domain-containing protein [Bdellovibrionia bacterium]